MMTLSQLELFLETSQADFALIRQEAPIYSVEDTKRYYNVRYGAPTFILESDRGLLACIVSAGHGRLDLAALKARFGFTRLRMAGREKLTAQTGYTAGAIPLIGHGLPCLFEEKLLAHRYIYGGTGDALCTLKIAPGDVRRLNRVLGLL